MTKNYSDSIPSSAGTPPAIGVTAEDLAHLRDTLSDAEERRYELFTEMLSHRDRCTLQAIVEDYSRTFLGDGR